MINDSVLGRAVSQVTRIREAGDHYRARLRMLGRRGRRGAVIILDVVLMTLIATAIVSLLMWSICTQYRDRGCEHLRIRRRLRISVRLVTLDEPEIVPSTRIAL